MTAWRAQRYYEAYLMMAREARYRPQAPSDGFGGILLDDEELADPVRLHREAQAFARKALTCDDAMDYSRIVNGCPDGSANRAFVFALEAAELLCSPKPELASRLLQMALAEIAREYSLSPPATDTS